MQGYGAADPFAAASGENVDTSDGSDGIKDRGLYSLFLLMGIAPVVLFALVLCWEKRWNKQHQQHAERRAAVTKLVEPVREAHLTKLMKNYSMILSKSDIFDKSQHSDLCRDDCVVGEATDTSLSSGKDSDGNVCKTDDIEMQIPEVGQNNDEIRDSNSIECDDNSQCHHHSFCIPKAGQRLGGECGAMNLPRRIESDGCAVCMNPLDIGQKVVWSSNPECSHVFHQQCLLDWFVTVGAKKWRTQAARHLEMDPSSLHEEICKFPKLCPICRRNYFLETVSEEASTDNESYGDITNDNDGI